MTPEETLRETIFQQNFNNYTLKPANETIVFQTIAELELFLQDGIDFWSKFPNSQECRNVNHVFSKALNFCQQLNNYSEEGGIRSVLANIQNTLNSDYFISPTSKYAVLCERLYSSSHDQTEACLRFILHRQIINNNNANNFIGAIQAYELLRTEGFENENKFNQERLDKITAEYQSEIIKLKNENAAFLKSLEKTIDMSKANYDEMSAALKEKNDADKGIFDEALGKWKDNISKLEKTYDEKLMLSKPAEYWDTLRGNYETKGNTWKNYAILSTLIFVGIMIFLLFTLPEWLRGDFKIDHIKGIVIFSIIVTVSTYLIHLFIKLSISSFHLSRDAEERKQLTFLFLAMTKDKGLSDREREIVFQSLFSRADSGLLKNDGSPAIPGNIGDILKKFGS